jgi:hypothetical protein
MMTGHEEDSDHGGLFTSPSETEVPKEGQSDRPKTPSNQPGRYEDPEDTREAALRRELAGVRTINELIEGVVGTLERAQGNLQVRRDTSSVPTFFFYENIYIHHIPHVSLPSLPEILSVKPIS